MEELAGATEAEELAAATEVEELAAATGAEVLAAATPVAAEIAASKMAEIITSQLRLVAHGLFSILTFVVTFGKFFSINSTKKNLILPYLLLGRDS